MKFKDLRKNLSEQTSQPAQTKDPNAAKIAMLVRAGLLKTGELPLLRQARLRQQKQPDIGRLSKPHRDIIQKYNNALSGAAFGSTQSLMALRRNLMNSVEIEDAEQITESILSNEVNPPPMIVLKRKGIRIFPDGRRVALYTNDKLGLVFTIPYKGSGTSTEIIPGVTAEETEHDELLETIDQLKSYATQENPKTMSKHFKFADGSKMPIAHGVAKAMHMVHGALNDENKKKYEAMLNEPKGFKKAADFALSRVQFTIGGK
jgi:hypothetical protein